MPHESVRRRFFDQWRQDERPSCKADAILPNERKGKEKLSGQCWLLLLVNALFVIANALSGTFVNVFLWKVKSDLSLIGWFSLTNHVVMAITFFLAGKWVKEGNKMNALRLGVAVAAVFYTVVLYLGSNAVNYIYVLGAIQGLASGFFWLSFNVVYFEVTSPGTRDRFNGLAGLTGSAAGMFAPWISGFVIVHMAGTNGYRLIFSLSLATFVLGVITSFFLKKRESVGHYSWTAAFSSLKKPDGAWRRVATALTFQGMREGVFGFLIGLLVYIQTKNEMSLGNFSLITSAVALFSYFIVGRWFKRTYRRIGMLIGATVITLVIVPFFWSMTYFTLLVFGVGVALFFPLYGIPMTSTVFDLIGKDKASSERREEYIVLRELFLNVGRVLGTAVFLVIVSITSSVTALNWLMLGVGSAPLAAWFFIRKQLAAGNPKST